MIVQANFSKIFPIWKHDLWPDRTSEITETSAMCFLGGYSLDNMVKPATFFAYKIDNMIVGVNSVHPCSDGGYRSRGLYVNPDFRNKGIGTVLLKESIDFATSKGAGYIWSYPKYNSWSTYNKAGFKLASDWEDSELGKNAYCVRHL